MKNKLLFHFFAFTVLLSLFACSTEVDDAQQTATTHTYTMRLVANFQQYEGTVTRTSSYAWPDKAQVFVRFHEPNNIVTGIATYSLETETWSITPEKPLTQEAISVCEVLYFESPFNTTNSIITLSSASIAFADETASYYTDEEILTITALLSPCTARLRFKGSANAEFGVTGLTCYTKYDIKAGSFTSASEKISGKIGNDGYSPYYYVFFADANSRILSCDYLSTASFNRAFGAGVLAKGSSGFITLPTIENREGWTITNKDNQKEITLPTFSNIEITNVKSRSAQFAGTIASVGNGNLSDAGYVYASHAAPTLADAHVSTGNGTAISDRVKSLTPQTQYYIRAYAINEAGTSYSEEVTFTTQEAPKGTEIGRDEYPEDTNWD